MSQNFCFQYILRLTWRYSFSSEISIGLSDGSGIKKRNFAVIKSCLRFDAHAVWYDVMFARLTLTLTMLNNEKKKY